MNIPRFCAMCFVLFRWLAPACLLIARFIARPICFECACRQSWGDEHVVWSEVRKCYDFGAKNLSLQKKNQQREAFIWRKQGAHFEKSEEKIYAENEKKSHWISHNIHQSSESERTKPRSLNHLTFHSMELKIDINWRFDYLPCTCGSFVAKVRKWKICFMVMAIKVFAIALIDFSAYRSNSIDRIQMLIELSTRQQSGISMRSAARCAHTFMVKIIEMISPVIEFIGEMRFMRWCILCGIMSRSTRCAQNKRIE